MSTKRQKHIVDDVYFDTYSIGVVVDVQSMFVVHWLQGQVILQIFGKDTFAGHVVAQSVVQVCLCIVHKSISSSLHHRRNTLHWYYEC